MTWPARAPCKCQCAAHTCSLRARVHTVARRAAAAAPWMPPGFRTPRAPRPRARRHLRKRCCARETISCALSCACSRARPPATTRSTSNLWRVLLTGAGTHRLLAIHNESLASSDESRPRARAGKEALRVASTCRSFRAALAPSESGIWSTFYAQECVPGYRRGPHLASPRKKQDIRPQQCQFFLQRTAWSGGLNGRESSGPERGFFRLEQLPPRAGC